MTVVARIRPSTEVDKYVAIALLSFKQRIMERADILGRIGFYFVLLLVFSRLWAAVHENTGDIQSTPSDFLWYLAVTEWILLSQPPVYLDIESDVRRGDIAFLLVRPIPYIGAKLAEAVGDSVLRLSTLAVAGFLFAYFLTGSLPKEPLGLLLVVPLGLAASLLTLLFYVMIGLSAFWLQDCTPMFWVWQKLCFVLGGLVLPLSIYPVWLQKVSLFSPFSVILYGPGRMVFAFDPLLAFQILLQLLLWIAIVSCALFFLYRRSQRIIEINGG